ncbi:MAG: transposase [Betaproteobacteria bacterium]|nr:transposase [Betaproteobacteria bacterium]
MPRLSRTVIPGVPHHVTQRGNRQGRVFFSDDDCDAYLEWLAHHCRRREVEVIAYCLMPNHVHLVLVPPAENGLERALRPVHTRFAQRINRLQGWSGHLWQGRFFSAPLDGDYFYATVRYVERNPVRAGMVARAEDYRWSSAAAHCGWRGDRILTQDPGWNRALDAVGEWSRWIAADEGEVDRDEIRESTRQNRPCGSEEFVRAMASIVGRDLQRRPQGGQERG